MSSEWTKERAMDILSACHSDLESEPKEFAREALAYLRTLLAKPPVGEASVAGEVDRFVWKKSGDGMMEAPGYGAFMYYDDHIRIVAEKDAEIARRREDFDTMTAVFLAHENKRQAEDEATQQRIRELTLAAREMMDDIVYVKGGPPWYEKFRNIFTIRPGDF